MSGGMLAGVGGGIGHNPEPTYEEALAATKALLQKVAAAFQSHEVAKDGEVLAHRAQVLANLAGELVGATYTLQRAAYAKATKQ